MGWIFLEVFIAFFLLIGIVWWTLPSKRDEERRHNPQKKDEQHADSAAE
jgi:hypothetical protein